MKIGEKLFAVVLDTGVIQTLTHSKESVDNAVEADKRTRGYNNKACRKVKEVVITEAGSTPMVVWGLESELGRLKFSSNHGSREKARTQKASLVRKGYKARIIRREYILVNEKVVS